MFRTCGVTLIFAAGALFAMAQSDEQQLLAIDQQWLDAEIKHDEAVLNRILDDRFIVLTTTGRVIKSKAAFIDMVRKFTFTSATVTHDLIEVFGHTAIMIDRLTTRSADGVESSPVLCMATYIKQQGQWRAIGENFARPAPSH